MDVTLYYQPEAHVILSNGKYFQRFNHEGDGNALWVDDIKDAYLFRAGYRSANYTASTTGVRSYQIIGLQTLRMYGL
jgi:hypothetical protein